MACLAAANHMPRGRFTPISNRPPAPSGRKKTGSNEPVVRLDPWGSVAATTEAARAVADILALGCGVALGAVAARALASRCFAGAGQADDDRATVDGHAVQRLDGGLGDFF